MNALHPTAVLCLWASTAVFVQTLPVPWLWLGVLAVSVAAYGYARERFGRLARRIRVLCLVTLVLFTFATPGVRMFPALIWLPATWDGVALGAAHVARLLAMVALVAVLLERMNVAELISALHHAMGFSRRFGVPVDRIAVRLSLVLGAVERTDSGWRRWLLDAESPGAAAVASIDVRALGLIDGTCIILALGGLVIWGLA